MDVGEEQPVAERVECQTEQTESVRGSRVERCEPVLFGESMLRRELKSPSSHLLVIAEVRAAAIPSTLLHVIRKDSAEPERVVA